MTPATKLPVDFRPMQGLLSIGQKLAAAFGLANLWEGHDGFEGVMRQKLTELGVPEQPVPISGANAMTPRQMAEASGFIKRPKVQRRVQAKLWPSGTNTGSAGLQRRMRSAKRNSLAGSSISRIAGPLWCLRRWRCLVLLRARR